MTFWGVLEVAFRNDCLKVINSMAYQSQTKLRVTQLYLTGVCVRADDLLVHASAVHKHKMLCFRFSRHFIPNLYWPIYYNPYFLLANFTSDLCSQPQNNFMRPEVWYMFILYDANIIYF